MAGMSTLDVWYSHIDVVQLLADLEAAAGSSGSKAAKQMAAVASQDHQQGPDPDSLQALDKLTAVVDGQRRIVSDPPLIVPIEELFPRSRAMQSSHSSTSCCAATATPSRPTVGTCWRSSICCR